MNETQKNVFEKKYNRENHEDLLIKVTSIFHKGTRLGI